MPSIRDIISAVERIAPLHLQESYDNSGLQVGTTDADCTGVLITVDVTPDTIDEAVRENCNLIIAHHPILFHGLKRISGETLVQRTVIEAIKAGITIYSSHTCLDNAPAGISHRMAQMLGLQDVKVLAPQPDDSACGSGCIGNLQEAMDVESFVGHVKSTFDSPITRCSAPRTHHRISKVALCGGSGSFLIPAAIKVGAQAIVTSDTKYHDFIDYADYILIVDIGHHESENCAKDIFYHAIKEIFPNFAVRYSKLDTNPIIYI